MSFWARKKACEGCYAAVPVVVIVDDNVPHRRAGPDAKAVWCGKMDVSQASFYRGGFYLGTSLLDLPVVSKNSFFSEVVVPPPLVQKMARCEKVGSEWGGGLWDKGHET